MKGQTLPKQSWSYLLRRREVTVINKEIIVCMKLGGGHCPFVTVCLSGLTVFETMRRNGVLLSSVGA